MLLSVTITIISSAYLQANYYKVTCDKGGDEASASFFIRLCIQGYRRPPQCGHSVSCLRHNWDEKIPKSAILIKKHHHFFSLWRGQK